MRGPFWRVPDKGAHIPVRIRRTLIVGSFRMVFSYAPLPACPLRAFWVQGLGQDETMGKEYKEGGIRVLGPR